MSTSTPEAPAAPNASEANSVLVYGGGFAYRAPKGTALPTSATGTLDPAFVDTGEIGSDGYTVQPKATSKTIKNAAGKTVRTLFTDASIDVGLPLIETTAITRQVWWGTPPDEDGKLSIDPTVADEGAWVFDFIDTVRKVRKRLVLPDASVTDRDEQKNGGDDELPWGVTLSGTRDADGFAGYEYVESYA